MKTQEQLEKEMAEIGVIPIEHECQHCGNIYKEGFVRAIMWPLQLGWLCPDCRKKFATVGFYDGNGHTWIRRTDYPPTRFKSWDGNCDICNAFPCEHVEQDEQGNWRLTK